MDECKRDYVASQRMIQRVAERRQRIANDLVRLEAQTRRMGEGRVKAMYLGRVSLLRKKLRACDSTTETLTFIGAHAKAACDDIEQRKAARA